MFGAEFGPQERGRFGGAESPEEFSELDQQGFGPHRRRCRKGPGRGGPHGHGGPRHRRRARRGDIRQAILLLLDDGPKNGYGLMQEVEERSGGSWRPSPGSVYPALAQLEDEGLVVMKETDGRKEFELTDDGKSWVEDNRDGVTPFDSEGRGVPKELGSLRKSTQALAMAARQLAMTGNPEQLDEARKVVDEARRQVYGILARDEEQD